MTSWDAEKEEAPLKIAVKDKCGHNPFSLAFFRGHFDVAKSILEIAQAQYSPAEKSKTRFRMADGSEDDEEYSDDDGSGVSDDSDSSEPRIYSHIVGGDFTIDNVGQVSMKVNSHTKPLAFLQWTCRGISTDGKPGESGTAFEIVIQKNDLKGLRLLLDLAEHHNSQKLDSEDEAPGFYAFPDNAFVSAVSLGRTELLSEIIKRTGAGLPLENLVKESGVELKEKPRYYQGLTVYGQKRYVGALFRILSPEQY